MLIIAVQFYLDGVSNESLDIWREGHLTDDSDLEILSGLIRLCPRFWCPNSSLSSQLCIDVQYISNRYALDHIK